MKREDIAKLVEGATEAQITALLDLNSRDIGRAKGDASRMQAELEAARGQLEAAKAASEEGARLREQLEACQKRERERAEEQARAEARKALERRFDEAAGTRAFLHEYVREGVLGEFERALADEGNAGKGDQELFEALVRDKGCFASQNPPVQMGGMSASVREQDIDKLSDREYYQNVFARGGRVS